MLNIDILCFGGILEGQVRFQHAKGVGNVRTLIEWYSISMYIYNLLCLQIINPVKLYPKWFRVRPFLEGPKFWRHCHRFWMALELWVPSASGRVHLWRCLQGTLRGEICWSRSWPSRISSWGSGAKLQPWCWMWVVFLLEHGQTKEIVVTFINEAAPDWE